MKEKLCLMLSKYFSIKRVSKTNFFDFQKKICFQEKKLCTKKIFLLIQVEKLSNNAFLNFPLEKTNPSLSVFNKKNSSIQEKKYITLLLIGNFLVNMSTFKKFK